ncbi:MAG: DUF2064 domain-containing protein, partial [Desulfobacterales bacterium]|nr:DUF2064 domain-containing protein [Desulfobacterales bacterium]
DTVLLDGLEKLRNTQAIIGPAFDGGYYLIGVQGNIGETNLQYIFTDISWGSANVCHQTIERLTALQMRYELLKKLHDIDTPDDLTYLNHHPGTE